jgi:hypothetical protein
MQGQGPVRERAQRQQQMHERSQRQIHRQPLNPETEKLGSFRMLQQKTGMNAEELQKLYASSGARNYGQFASAVVVSKNLNLDTQKVLDGAATNNLGQTLQNLGVDRQTARTEIKKAHQEIYQADTQPKE